MAKAATLKAVEKEENEDTDLPSIVEYDEDLSEAEAPLPLPVRQYPAVISGAKKRTNKNGGVYAEVLFLISADDYPADYAEQGPPQGTTLAYRRVSLENNPQARYQAKKFCESIGAPMGKRIDLNDWMGLEAVVDIKHEAYEGVDRAVVDRVHAA